MGVEITIFFFKNNEKTVTEIYCITGEVRHPPIKKRSSNTGHQKGYNKTRIKTNINPSLWTDKKLIAQSGELRRLGNDQNVPTVNVARVIKYEDIRSLDRDKDTHIDLCKMMCKKKKIGVILLTKFPFFLMYERQIRILHVKKNVILNYCRNTLCFDLTGSVVKKYEDKKQNELIYAPFL